MRRLAPALALALAGCTTTQLPDDPVPGREARAVLLPPAARAEPEWPDAFRRGAVFAIENRLGAPVETLILEVPFPKGPREILEATILDPPGRPTTILDSAHGYPPRRVLLGTPGTVLLEPGATLRVLLRVDGKPGLCRVRITVPGLSEE